MILCEFYLRLIRVSLYEMNGCNIILTNVHTFIVPLNHCPVYNLLKCLFFFTLVILLISK